MLDTTNNGLDTTLNSAYNEVAFNKILPIMKENLSTKYTPFTYKYITLNEKPPITKQNLHIFFFIIGRVECIILDPKEMLGITDLRSLGYYKIKQGTLQQNLSKYYRFERVDTLCEEFNKYATERETARRIKRKIPMTRS